MRDITVEKITDSVKKLCMDATRFIGDDVLSSLKVAQEGEKWPIAKDILADLITNYEIAASENLPMCQDTGMVYCEVEIGQEVHIVGGTLEKAINDGVALGYTEGYLRKSVVSDPIERINTKNNTPAVITYKIVDGENLKITVAPKGFGSENMSQLKMLKPSDGLEGVKEFVLKVVKEAGPNPCPPIVVGVGIGGTFDRVALLAKQAAIRNVDSFNSKPYYEKLERELLESVNALGIGPQGFGGKTTALKVNIEIFPTHIAGLPVAVNINCHAARHKSVVL